jgi:hypothetical protein
MFVAHALVLDVGFGAARARLAHLVYRGELSGSSEEAYEDGLATLIRVGPFGDLPGASKLVRVSFLDPVYREEAMTVGLRWEATGATVGLFPVLDADIEIAPAGDQQTRLALVGSYRPPLGRFGAGLDKVLLNQVATATVSALLRDVADALVSPAPATQRCKGSAVSPILTVAEHETPA